MADKSREPGSAAGSQAEHDDPALAGVAAVGVVALIFVFWGQPSVALVIWLVVLLLAVPGVIELLGGGTPRAAAPVPQK